MVRHLGWPAFITALLVAPVALPAGPPNDEQKGQAMLVRPAGSSTLGAKGIVEIEHHVSVYEEAFDVEASDLEEGKTYEVFLEDLAGTGNMVAIGVLTENEPGGSDDGDDDDDDDDETEEEHELEFDTDDGDSLPFGVPYASQLTGLRVEVRTDGELVLAGVVPAIGDGASSEIAKSKLMRPVNPADGDVKGKVVLNWNGPELAFGVEADEIDASATSYSVWLEETAGSAVFHDVGSMSSSGGSSSDEVHLEIETGDGESLPLGVHDLHLLVGLSIEVRGDDGHVYLVGSVPAAGAASFKEKSKLTGTGKGAVRIQRQAKKGDEKFSVKLKKMPKSTSLEVWIESAVAGEFELAETLSTKKSGRASWKVETKHGESLPCGVLSLEALAGRWIEVRLPESGEVLLSGSIPTVD